jgi:hypothetical protein
MNREPNNWKGDNASYSAFHYRLYTRRGRPVKCEQCGLDDPKRVYHWANLTGRFQDLYDYKSMCVSCHRKYDYARKPAKQFKMCKKNLHEMTTENVYLWQGIRRCRACWKKRLEQHKAQRLEEVIEALR